MHSKVNRHIETPLPQEKFLDLRLLSILWKMVNPSDIVCQKKTYCLNLCASKAKFTESTIFSLTRYQSKIPKGFIRKTHSIGLLVILCIELSHKVHLLCCELSGKKAHCIFTLINLFPKKTFYFFLLFLKWRKPHWNNYQWRGKNPLFISYLKISIHDTLNPFLSRIFET